MKKLYLLVSILFVGCGPYSMKSFKPDSKIRADYLNDSTGVAYKIFPSCKTNMTLFIYWSKTCHDPYAIQVKFYTKRNIGPVSIVPKSIALSIGQRNYELLSTSLKDKPIVLEQKFGDQLQGHIDIDLPRSLIGEAIKTFDVSTIYVLMKTGDSSTVEKEFHWFKEYEWQPRFG